MKNKVMKAIRADLVALSAQDGLPKDMQKLNPYDLLYTQRALGEMPVVVLFGDIEFFAQSCRILQLMHVEIFPADQAEGMAVALISQADSPIYGMKFVIPTLKEKPYRVGV